MLNFSNTLIGVMFASGLAVAFIDQDRRGLSFFTEPEAFFAEEELIDPEPTSFPVIWGSASEPRPITSSQTRRPERNRNRTSAPANKTPSFEILPPASGPNSFAQVRPPAQSAPEAPTQVAGLQQITAPSTPVNTQQSPLPLASTSIPTATGNGLSLSNLNTLPVVGVPLGGGLVRVDPVVPVVPVVTDPEPSTQDPVIVTPVDPVVPAVPEPSSWILMILGVGFLGTMLRYRREPDEKDIPLEAIGISKRNISQIA